MVEYFRTVYTNTTRIICTIILLRAEELELGRQEIFNLASRFVKQLIRRHEFVETHSSFAFSKIAFWAFSSEDDIPINIVCHFADPTVQWDLPSIVLQSERMELELHKVVENIFVHILLIFDLELFHPRGTQLEEAGRSIPQTLRTGQQIEAEIPKLVNHA